MILVLLAASISITVIGFIMYERMYDEFPGIVTSAIGVIGLVISITASLGLLISVCQQMTIDDRITMYQEENAVIEEQISTIVEQYQKYETDIFTELSPESTITLVALYPELKADVLVNRQLEVYISNNETIKELKAEKIAGRVYRWWLYFGG